MKEIYNIILILQTMAAAYQSVNEKQLQNIRNYMNPQIDPCDNFYEFACGNWKQYHNSEHYTETTGLVDYKLNKQLIKFLESGHMNNNTSDGIYFIVGQYYKSCRSKHTRNGFKKYLQLVKPAAGLQWPILHRLQENETKWPFQHFNWFLTMAKLRRFGMNNIFIQHYVHPSLEDSNIYNIYLDKPDEESQWPSRAKVVYILLQLGVKKREAFEISLKLQNFMNQLKKLQALEDWPIELSIAELEQDATVLAWRKYFEIIFQHKINENVSIKIENWNYIMHLAEFLQKADPELVCNYLMINFLYYLWVDGANVANKIDCLKEVRSKMELAVNFLYINNILQNQAANIYKNELHKMFGELKLKFLQKLQENRNRFSVQQLQFLGKKLRHMSLNMGNIKAHIVAKDVEDYYSSIQLKNNSYFSNHLNLLQLHFKNEHKLLQPHHNLPHTFLANGETASSSNPYYLVRQNTIVLPYGILQTPMYHSNMHEVFKWGLFGFLMGHELSHGFDSSGLFYGASGNYQETSTNALNHHDPFDCIKNTETEETTHHIDERIADIVGIRLAYDVLFDKNKISTRINFTNLSAPRLFFLSFAQFFCGSLNGKFYDHDTDNVRLIQSLKNFEAFGKEFDCKLGSTMNPVKKCRLW